jgi:hypothetical protein
LKIFLSHDNNNNNNNNNNNEINYSNTIGGDYMGPIAFSSNFTSTLLTNLPTVTKEKI